MRVHAGGRRGWRSTAKSMARHAADRVIGPYFDELRAELDGAPKASTDVAEDGRIGQSPEVPEGQPEPGGQGAAPGPNAITISEFRRGFGTGQLSLSDPGAFNLDVFEVTPSSPDPTSEAYASEVMATWCAVSGRPRYVPEESESFELDPSISLPASWPYVSGNPVEVSHYLGAIARTLQLVGRPPPARVLEYGTGWGHMALTLAATGFEVSAVDLNPSSVELLRRRADSLGVDLAVVRSGFLDHSPEEPVDAVVFFEAFHHCDRPFTLLDRCIEALAPGGRLVFVAEALYRNYHAPWGVRPDGHAVLMTATEGWLELGFDLDFFIAQLEARGLTTSYEVDSALGAHGTFLVARSET